MTSYLVRRFGLMLLMLFGISVIIFAMLRIAPGNIADILFDAAGFVDPAEKAQIMKDLGLDQPLSGRCLPSAFGMYVRREGRGRYAPPTSSTISRWPAASLQRVLT